MEYPGLLEEIEEGYQVKLDSFTGPLDLLLHLIRKQEINIYDIPIALITRQFLDYLNLMKNLNLSFAGEFLVMAATLLQIKSRMLLPKEESENEVEDSTEDPRDELIRRLVEYERFKEAAFRLSSQEKIWGEAFSREPTQAVREKNEEEVAMDDLNLFDLLGALQEVLNRTTSESFLDVSMDTQTVQDRINAILERLESEAAVNFYSLFDSAYSRSLVILTFLALLELVRMKLVRLYQSNLFGPIRVTRAFLPEESNSL